MKKQLLFKISLIGLLLISGGYFFLKEKSKPVDVNIQSTKKVKRAKRSKEYSQYFKDITTQMSSKNSAYMNSYRYNELQKALRFKSDSKTGYEWINRGPANIGGRTRALVVDPDDASNSTWFVGAATGGVWKTTDKGDNWTNLTTNIPNLSTGALVMASSNHNVLYAGTGESFPGGTYMAGSGIFKSTDKGQTWDLLTSTSENDNFIYVNRIIVDYADEDILIAATNNGIYKSIDGGTSWSNNLSTETNVEQIIAEPSNFDVQYATINGEGIVKSVDAGDTWNLTNNQLIPTGRIELAVSPVNEDVVFASVDENNTNVEEGIVPTVYMSTDKGVNWVVYKQEGTSVDFLRQGSYDNTIAAHPFQANSVFVGGVNINQITFDGDVVESDAKILNVYAENTDSFLSFVNFGGTYLGGGLAIEDGENPIDVVDSDWCAIEVRFGAGMSQKAHRFTVGGVGAGVPLADYVYEDYVDVPFEVWDMTNNRQLMVSFRDQEEDGKFDLEARDENDETIGREYIFINAVEYSETADADIAKDGGRAYKQLYFFWPSLADGASWDENNLPASKIVINYGTQVEQEGQVDIIADAYGSTNSYDQTAGKGTTKIPGLHPDHHSITIIPGATEMDDFTILNTNDGGIAISEDSGESFEMKIHNFNTTQFYGVSKKHGADEYIGGMQDNGTWQSKIGEAANEGSYYYFRIGGDGFQTMWNYNSTSKLMGSLYYNNFSVSTNGGVTWKSATSGITYDEATQSYDGPFLTKLSSSKSKPSNLYAVGTDGIWKNRSFGTFSWTMQTVGTKWSASGIRGSHNVKVSLANDNFVWAGAGMADDFGYNLYISTDEGDTYTAVPDFADVKMDAYISGIATHPTLDSTAFALFSLQGMPKVLRTDDLGQTWRDLSGFADLPVKGAGSTNGFPDVVVNDLLVMPYNTDIIWVGTDIGIFESTDEGASWHILTSDLPYVSVYQMQIVDDQVVIATHGRGVWTVTIPEIRKVPILTDFDYKGLGVFTIDVELYDLCDKLEIYANGELQETVTEYNANSINTFEFASGEDGPYKVFVKAFYGSEAYESNASNFDLNTVGINSIANDVERLNIYPNPSKGLVNFKMNASEINKDYHVKVMSLSGKEVYNAKGKVNSTNQIQLSDLDNGQYVIMLYVEGNFYVEKLLIQK